mmetsp:Transcript_38891/g.94155  ORF Transcript_38891/g.94155 Transcript_38891/m.94155 type:complete len:573 (-) Transcript_38891:79-1797(-)
MTQHHNLKDVVSYTSSLVLAVAVGYAVGAGTSDNDDGIGSIITTVINTLLKSVLDPFHQVLIDDDDDGNVIENRSTTSAKVSSSSSSSSSPSWFNLYKSLVLLYITIRWYHILIEPVIKRILVTVLASTGVLYSLPTVMLDTVDDDGQGLLRSSFSSSSSLPPGTPSSGTVMSPRRSSLTAKDISVFAHVKEVQYLSAVLEEDNGDGDVEEEDKNDEEKEKQPIDLSGVYELRENHNFEEFLEAQGIPWMLRRAANQARPTHRITHIGQYITIKIEGLIESSSTYTINGPPVEGLIRGRLFADKITYLTPEDVGEPKVDDEVYSVDSDYSDDYDDNDQNKIAVVAGTIDRSISKKSNLDNKGIESPGSKVAKDGMKRLSVAKTTVASSPDRAISTNVTVSDKLKQMDVKMELMKREFQQNLDDMKRGFQHTVDNIKGRAMPSKVSDDNNNNEDDDDDEKNEAKIASPPADGGETNAVDVERTAELTIDTQFNETKKKTRRKKMKPVRIIGIKTTKRAINDQYTIIVCRRLADDRSNIIMTSTVEFDDKSKNKGSGQNGVYESRQIFERVGDV